MPFTNVTTITEFVIIGFPGLQPRYNRLLSLLLLFIYLSILAGNSFVVIIVAMERQLQKPTYLIFCNLAVSDLIYGSNMLPKAIARYWAEDKTISFPGCLLQMFLVHFLGTFSSFMLLIMALDRYIAICNPLRYHALIKNSTIGTFACLSFLLGLVRMIPVLLLTMSLPYCSSNEILNCYCDNIALTSLACEHAAEVQNIAFAFAMCVFLIPISFIVFSYISIITSIVKIRSSNSRFKMFSTCTSQIIIICVYYIPRCVVYIANKLRVKLGVDLNIAMIMLYTLFPPLVNPLIYCLWTKEIKETVVRKLKLSTQKIGIIIRGT